VETIDTDGVRTVREYGLDRKLRRRLLRRTVER